MPRIPRNPGFGKKPHNGPAQGPGWGGPAQGAHPNSPPSLATGPKWQPGAVVNPGGVRGERANAREAQAEQVLDRLYSSAMGLERGLQPVEVMAQREFLNRVKGMPKQTQEQTGDVTYTIVTGVPRARD